MKAGILPGQLHPALGLGEDWNIVEGEATADLLWIAPGFRAG